MCQVFAIKSDSNTSEYADALDRGQMVCFSLLIPIRWWLGA